MVDPFCYPSLLLGAHEVFADDNENYVFRSHLVLSPSSFVVLIRHLWCAKILILFGWKSLFIKVVKIILISGRNNTQWSFQVLRKLLYQVRRVDAKVLTVEIWTSF